MTTETTAPKDFVTGSGEPTEATAAPTMGETKESTEQARSALLRQAYGAATTRLRESHREEFDRLYAAEATQRGVEYTPRLTAEQKAEQEFQRLLEQYPHLAEKAGKQD